MLGRPVVVLGLLLTLIAPSAARGQTSATFEADILPILNAHCLQCHGGVHQRNGLDLRTHAALLRGGKSGPAVVPGSAEQSLLWKLLSRDEMPRTDNKVSETNKKRIRDWIEAGAKGSEKKEQGTITRAAQTPAEIARLIDTHLAKKLAASKTPASPPADDAEFLRRAYLDITGKPPASDQTLAYLADSNPEKKTKLVDDLLASPDFGRHFAERTVNLFYLPSVNDRPPNPQPFRDWLAGRINLGDGWGHIVRDIITASGPLTEAPQGLFYYYTGDMNGGVTPKIIVGNVAQVFLGVQLQCAECHDHPFADWKQTEFWSLAAFFATTARMEAVENKMTAGIKDRHLEVRPGKPQPPLKDISITIPKDGETRQGGKRVVAGLLGSARLDADPNKSHRPPLAEWLTSKDNRLFARATLNRLWAHFFARGFVNPLNDLDDHNRPSHPELFDLLTDEWVASGYDLKQMIRGICASDAYRRSSRVVAGNQSAEAEALFARMASKVLPPEELYDSLCVALEVPEIVAPALQGKKANPKGPPPPTPREEFVKFFRGPGDTDEPTELKLGVPHILRTMNEANFNFGGKIVERAMTTAKTPEEAIDVLFVGVLARPATAEERRRFAEFVARQPTPREGYDRVVWVLVNSTAFLLNR